MLQFIPFEDDWDALERLRPEELIPYRVGLLPEPASPATASTTPFPRKQGGAMMLAPPTACPAAGDFLNKPR
ncbi:MAG: hypothetical protein EPN69_12330 [Rhodanobacter sp.]|nr:MAG: hypothetical protein EPN69_12330 [Rhodanobacter sp.]